MKVVVLLLAGLGLLLAGLTAIGFGIAINEFSLGNTLIVSGTVAASTGMLLIGFWMAVRELKTIAGRLGPGAESPSARTQAAENGGFLSRAQPGSENDGNLEPAPPSSLPWHGEAAPRDRAPDDRPPAPVEESAPAAKQRRNLLFSSSSRKERERTQARSFDPSMSDPHPESGAPPRVPESVEAPPASFEDAWPKPDRSRSDALPPSRRAGRTPSTFAEAGPAATGADHNPPAARSDEPSQVTVLKSGVVDGMAYSLYSDGSIEAQMPEGMMRFASIDELRAHLDQRS